MEMSRDGCNLFSILLGSRFVPRLAMQATKAKWMMKELVLLLGHI